MKKIVITEITSLISSSGSGIMNNANISTITDYTFSSYYGFSGADVHEYIETTLHDTLQTIELKRT